jgi:hypothetical protein
VRPLALARARTHTRSRTRTHARARARTRTHTHGRTHMPAYMEVVQQVGVTRIRGRTDSVSGRHVQASIGGVQQPQRPNPKSYYHAIGIQLRLACKHQRIGYATCTTRQPQYIKPGNSACEKGFAVIKLRRCVYFKS